MNSTISSNWKRVFLSCTLIKFPTNMFCHRTWRSLYVGMERMYTLWEGIWWTVDGGKSWKRCNRKA